MYDIDIKAIKKRLIKFDNIYLKSIGCILLIAFSSFLFSLNIPLELKILIILLGIIAPLAIIVGYSIPNLFKIRKKCEILNFLNQNGKLIKGIPFQIFDSKIVIYYTLKNGRTTNLESDPLSYDELPKYSETTDLIIDDSNENLYYIDLNINRLSGNKEEDFYKPDEIIPTDDNVQNDGEEVVPLNNTESLLDEEDISTIENNKEQKIINLFVLLIYIVFIAVFYYFLQSHFPSFNFFEISLFFKKYICFIVSIILVSCFYSFVARLFDKWLCNRKVMKIVESDGKIDFTKYCREYINKYPIGLLGLCYNKHVSFKDSAVATILTLKHEGKIDIIDNKIITKKVALSDSENFIVEFFLKKKKINYSLLKEYKEILQDEGIKYNLFNHGSVYTFFKSTVITILLIMFFSNFLILCFTKYLSKILPESFFFVSFVFYFLFLGVAILFSVVCNRILFKNAKGIDISAKLIGLKNYLSDFTRINKRKIEELPLWGYYMIYAVLFDLKDQLDDEAKDLYKLLFKNKDWK